MTITTAIVKRVVVYMASLFAIVNTYVNVGALPTATRSVMAAAGALIIAIEHAAGVKTPPAS